MDMGFARSWQVLDMVDYDKTLKMSDGKKARVFEAGFFCDCSSLGLGASYVWIPVLKHS
jgi:hypothetical protein